MGRFRRTGRALRSCFQTEKMMLTSIRNWQKLIPNWVKCESSYLRILNASMIKIKKKKWARSGKPWVLYLTDYSFGFTWWLFWRLWPSCCPLYLLAVDNFGVGCSMWFVTDQYEIYITNERKLVFNCKAIWNVKINFNMLSDRRQQLVFHNW